MPTKKENSVSDIEATVDLTGSSPDLPMRDDVDEDEDPSTVPSVVTIEPPNAEAAKKHLRGLVEALVFASDQPIKPADIGKLAHAPSRQIKEVLEELRAEYTGRGLQLEEIAGGWAFRTNVVYAPFVRDLVGQKPVRLTRAQLETLAIVAYRQPVTRPEIDDVRGVDCGPVLRTLLERDLVRILGKKEEAGRPILYGTSAGFLQLFGLKSLKDLPTLREFTELNEESKRVVEQELGDQLEEKLGGAADPELPPPTQPAEGDRPTLESAGFAGHHEGEESPPESKELEHEAPVAPAREEGASEEDDDEWDDDDEDDDDWDDDDDDDDEDEADE